MTFFSSLPRDSMQEATRRWVDPDAIPSFVGLGLIATALFAGMVLSGLGYRGMFDILGIGTAVLWYAGARLSRIGAARIGTFVQTFAVFVGQALLTPLASAALAVTGRPYADSLLSAVDQRLFFGFAWPASLADIKTWTKTLFVLSHAYASLDWQPPLLLAFLCLVNQTRNAWIFMTALAITLLGCLLLFPWFPAVGAYVHLGISHEAIPGVRVPAAWDAAKVLDGLRSGTIATLDDRALTGIITMPSFHAAAAVLLAWSFRTIRFLCIPFAMLNALMFVSSVPIGGHYLVDVVLGAVIAGTAIVMATRWHQRIG